MPAHELETISHEELVDTSRVFLQRFAQRKIQEQRVQNLAQEFRIKQDLRRRKFEVAGKERIGFFAETVRRGNWLLIPPDDREKVDLQENYYYLNGAREELAVRQLPDSTSNRLQEKHEYNIAFTVQNWNTIAPLLYQNKPRTQTDNLPVFFEVDVSDYGINPPRQSKSEEACGKIDILGFGPDGQGFIIDFAKSPQGKASQLQGHGWGATEVIGKANHGIVPPINRLIGEYSYDQNMTVIRFKKAMDMEAVRPRGSVTIYDREIYRQEMLPVLSSRADSAAMAAS